MIHTQNQGIINGVKNSASVRFLAKVANMLKPEDITKERKRFTADNLSADNQSGMVIYDGKFADVKPIESKPFTVNAAQMAQINENVFNYFGTNAKIIQNNYTRGRMERVLRRQDRAFRDPAFACYVEYDLYTAGIVLRERDHVYREQASIRKQ